MSNYVRFDSKASLQEARSRLPLVRVMEQFGQAPPEGKTKSFRCPHCRKKAKAGIFIRDGVEFFKCQSTSCPTGARAMEAVGYLAFVSGRSRSDAFTDYLKMAGVWKERARYQDRSLPERPAEPEPATQATEGTTDPAPPAEVAAPAVDETAPWMSDEEIDAMAGRLDAATTPEAAPPPAALVGPPAVSTKQKEPTEELCREALCDFYSQLTLDAVDDRLLFEKRGITTAVHVALGFKSNRRSNPPRLRVSAHYRPGERILRAQPSRSWRPIWMMRTEEGAG